MLSSKRAWSGD